MQSRPAADVVSHPNTEQLTVLQARPEAADGAEGAALDLHKGISTPTPSTACERWPDHLLLESTLGHRVKGRCKSTNLCDYCARLAAVENSEVLALDALHGTAPLLWAVLTTPSTNPDQAHYYESRRKVQKALRLRWPECEIAWILEFTTGYGAGAGGERRPHWNMLIKGVPADAAEAVHAVIAKVWCPRQGASPDAQFVGEIGAMGGLMRYLALHFQKESQSPPKGWTGHRFTKTRGYLWLPTPEARQVAREALRYKRAVHRIWQLNDEHDLGLVAEEVHENAVRQCYEASELAWTLMKLVSLPATWDEDGLPATFEVVSLPV